MTKLKKRKLCWIHQPAEFEILCEKCEKNDQLEWSEFESHVWCRRCKIDSCNGFGGIFSGPIPVEAVKLIMGDDAFSKFDIKTGRIYEFTSMTGRAQWRIHHPNGRYDWRPTKRFGKLVRNPERDKFEKEAK
jgi:hypothetical protein